MTKDATKKNELKKKISSKKVLGALVLVGIVGLGGVVYKNPDVWDNLKQKLGNIGKQEDVYQSQISLLQQQINNLQVQMNEAMQLAQNPNFEEINKRIDNIEQINVNTIKSKADVETVLGLVMRMDNAEGRINDLAKVTNDSALVLTAAMLVKDAAERGGEFVYEAEVLKELAKGNYKIAKEVALIESVASKGIPNVLMLQDLFAKVYAEKYDLQKEENEPANWKERIYQQVNKVVKIEKASEVKEKEFSEEDRAWGIVADLVEEGDIAKAILIARKPINQDLLRDKAFSEWLTEAEVYDNFAKAVAKISANSLAVMKVEFLKNTK